MTPTVSVVTPFLNAARHLDAAIRSVQCQRLTDWELLLVDDGSTDGSVEVARRAERADPTRVRVLPPDPGRRGAAAARNRGIEVARGRFVGFLDADDELLPDKLSRDVAALETDEVAALVYSATQWWYDGLPGRDREERLGVTTGCRYSPPTLLVRVLLAVRWADEVISSLGLERPLHWDHQHASCAGRRTPVDRA